MDSDHSDLDVFHIHSDEFRFLDYPNTFLSGKETLSNGDLNKSANTQLEENLRELLRATRESGQSEPCDDGRPSRTNYLDDLNDLKELKRIEDKKSYQQSLDRLSRLNLGTSNGSLNTNGRRFSTYKAESKQLRTFRSNNHLPGDEPSRLDSTFVLPGEENGRTFGGHVPNGKLLNLSPEKQQDADAFEASENTFVVAKNYDEVQEIARKQEEALKKSHNVTMNFMPMTPPSHSQNATITKVKRNGLHKLDNTITLKHLINENLGDCIKSPNLDGTFNLGNPMENFQPTNHQSSPSLHYNGTAAHRNSFVLSQKNATNVKRVLNSRNPPLESKNNRLNSSFIVSDPVTILQPSQQQQAADEKSMNMNNTFELPNSAHQFSTITKNKIHKNLKRTNTFKVREFQYASEENLTFSKTGGQLLNPASFVRSGLSVNNYPSIDDMKNYETIKLSQRKVNKLTSSKSNSNITTSKTLYNLESNENLNEMYKADAKLPAFTSRLKAPSRRISVMKSEEI